jgi:hypothetical protein
MRVPTNLLHGSGNITSIHQQGFNPQLTGAGGHDQLGSGYYFTNTISDANDHMTSIRIDLPLGATKLGGDNAPGVAFVNVELTKPIILSQEENNIDNYEFDLTEDQIYQIIKKCPRIFDLSQTPLVDHCDDVHDNGVKDRNLREAARFYIGQPLSSLEVDFFNDKGESEIYRMAAFEATGFDGVIHDKGDGLVHVVAWFKEQVVFTPEHYLMYQVQQQLTEYKGSLDGDQLARMVLKGVDCDTELKGRLFEAISDGGSLSKLNEITFYHIQSVDRTMDIEQEKTPAFENANQEHSVRLSR